MERKNTSVCVCVFVLPSLLLLFDSIFHLGLFLPSMAFEKLHEKLLNSLEIHFREDRTSWLTQVFYRVSMWWSCLHRVCSEILLRSVGVRVGVGLRGAVTSLAYHSSTDRPQSSIMDGVIVFPSAEFEKFGGQGWETRIMMEESLIVCSDETLSGVWPKKRISGEFRETRMLHSFVGMSWERQRQRELSRSCVKYRSGFRECRSNWLTDCSIADTFWCCPFRLVMYV